MPDIDVLAQALLPAAIADANTRAVAVKGGQLVSIAAAPSIVSGGGTPIDADGMPDGTIYLQMSFDPAVALAPLDRVVVLGASLETGAFGNSINTQNTEIVYAQNRVQNATGKAITIHQYAVAGQDLAGMMSDSLPRALSEQASLPGNGRTLVIIGIGGNTVTQNRPLSAATLANAKAQLLDAISRIEAKGWDWCLFDLSWRNYSSPLCQYDRSQGSWPWVTAVSRTINATRNRLWGRKWTYNDGASWGDLYSLYRNNKQILADEVHPTDYLLTRNYIIDSVIIPAITGVPTPQRFIRDEAYPLTFTANAPSASGNSITAKTVSTHQGVAHIAVYAAGSTPTAAQVIAGTGGGFVAKTSGNRNGTTIDAVVEQTVGGLQTSTSYRVCSVFVSDAAQTSAVVYNDIVTTGTASAVGTEASIIVLRKVAIGSPRANINQLTLADGPTTTGTKIANVVNLAGVATGISFNVTAGFAEQGDTGNPALSVPGFFEAPELGEFWYVDVATAAATLSGLNPAKTYTLVFAGSRNVASSDTTRTGDIEIVAGTASNGAVKTLNGANPASGTTANSVSFTVTPTAGGAISFTYKRNSANPNGYAYLGGIFIKPN